jgi:hypothetical protein
MSRDLNPIIEGAFAERNSFEFSMSGPDSEIVRINVPPAHILYGV